MDASLELLDYRRIVSEMYARLRASPLDAPARCEEFRRSRDALFRSHPQSALSLSQRAAFRGLPYFPYDPAMRLLLPLEPTTEADPIDMHVRDDGVVRLRRMGRVRFALEGRDVSLTAFWILGYGGGVFLPFRDATNADETYGGGRYLLDTIKGADLGQDGAQLIIDFNYAYNPSCAYNPHWDCPLAPPENWLPVAIRAGELRYPG